MRSHIRSFPWRFPLLALVAGAFFAPASAAAQRAGRNTATMVATATVVASRLGAATVRGLEFGRIAAGAPVTVAPDGRTAAAWRLSGAPGAPVQVAFELPAVLVRDGDTASLPIRFGRGAGRWGEAAGQAFDPGTGTLARFGTEAAPTFEVRLGATVTPAPGTPGGAYRGTATLTLLYL